VRAAILLAALLAPATFAACGKGSATTTVVLGARASSAPGTTRTGGGPSTPAPATPAPSKQRALAFARAVNLTQADVPGFTPTEPHPHSSPAERKIYRELLACTGIAGKAHTVAEASSKSFALKHGLVDLSVSSEVTVAGSDAEAQRLRAAVQSAHVRACFSHYLELLFKRQHVKGATAGAVTIQSGTPPAPGTSGGFGWRVTARYIVRGVPVPFYLDVLGFIDGPSEVTLTSTGLLRPFPAEAQQHLFALLLSRAKEHTP
jgi:hypothetical protein